MGRRNDPPTSTKATTRAHPRAVRKRGRPPDIAKQKAILKAAEEVFFGGDPRRLNIEAIARCAGVSKATVYAQFGSLDTLLRAVIQEHREHMLRTLRRFPTTGRNLRASLVAFGDRLVDFLTSPRSIALHRMLATEFRGRKRLGRLIFLEGPATLCERLADILRAGQKEGALRLHEASTAAEQLLGMWQGIVLPGLVMGGCRRPGRHERRQRVRAAVEAWLRAYRV